MSGRIHMHWFWFGLFVYLAGVGALILSDVTSHKPIQYLVAFLGALAAPVVAVPVGMLVVKLASRAMKKQGKPEKERLL